MRTIALTLFAAFFALSGLPQPVLRSPLTTNTSGNRYEAKGWPITNAGSITSTGTVIGNKFQSPNSLPSIQVDQNGLHAFIQDISPTVPQFDLYIDLSGDTIKVTNKWILYQFGQAVFTNGPTISNGVYYGNGSGLTNIPLAALQTNSATSGQVAAFNGTTWVPTTPAASGVTAVGLNPLPAEVGTNSGRITSSGDLSWTNKFQSANTVWAGPTSGSAANPAFRALVIADVPVTNLNAKGGVNVKNFGAIGLGDGTDDTASISNAIIYAVTNVGSLTSSNVVYVPSGTYLVGPLLITNIGMTFYGDGLNMSRLTLKSNGNTLALLTISKPDVAISDLWIDGNTNLSYVSFKVNNQSFGIKAKAQGNSRVVNCRITSFSDGLFVDGTNDIANAEAFNNALFAFNEMSNCWFCLHFASSNNCEYTKIEGNTMMNGGYGFENETAANLVFTGNKVIGNTHGISIDPSATSSNPKRGHSIYSGNIINHNSSDSVSGTTAMDAAFVGNEMMGAGTIRLATCTNFFFSANHFQFNAATAVTLTSGLFNRFVGNNLTSGSGDALSGTTANNFYPEDNREVGVGTIWIQSTNLTVAPSGLHNIAIGKGWTNDLGSVAQIIIELSQSDAATGDPALAFTNSITGEGWTNKITGGLVQTRQGLIYVLDVCPNDRGSFTDVSTGSGSSQSFLQAWWKLKKQ